MSRNRQQGDRVAVLQEIDAMAARDTHLPDVAAPAALVCPQRGVVKVMSHELKNLVGLPRKVGREAIVVPLKGSGEVKGVQMIGGSVPTTVQASDELL